MRGQELVGPLRYPRHFLVLICVAVVLVATPRWVRPLGPLASFGLYGALHSASIVLALRPPHPLWRKLAFVAGAAALSVMSAFLSVEGMRRVSALPGLTGPALLLSLSSGVGAASYALWVRGFWIERLSLWAVMRMTLACVVAALATLWVVLEFFGGAGTVWFALVWWMAFSTGLWRYGDRRVRR